MSYRIGRYFVLVGALLFIVFYASYQNGTPDENILGWAILSGVVGVLLIIRNRKPGAAASVQRFRRFRAWQADEAKKKKEREDKKKAKEAAKKAKKK